MSWDQACEVLIVLEVWWGQWASLKLEQCCTFTIRDLQGQAWQQPRHGPLCSSPNRAPAVPDRNDGCGWRILNLGCHPRGETLPLSCGTVDLGWDALILLCPPCQWFQFEAGAWRENPALISLAPCPAGLLCLSDNAPLAVGAAALLGL